MSQPVSASERVRKIQRSALTMLLISGAINYIDRATLAVGNPLIRHDLGLSIADMGYLLSAFLWAYAFAQLPSGALVDRFRPRLLLTVGLSLWSLAQVASGLVASFGQFYVARLFLGAGEAPQFPTATRVTRDWFNPRNRGLASGIWNSAGPLGTALGVPLLTALMLAFGWRWMFIIMGVLGLVVAAIWFTLYRNPSQVHTHRRRRSPIAPRAIPRTRRNPVTFREWKMLFRFRTTWGMIIGYFGCIYMTWIYMAWLPGYLEIQRHMSVKYTGIAAAIPFAWGIAGSMAGGYIADRLIRVGQTALNSRKIPASLALVGTAAFTIAAAYVQSNTARHRLHLGGDLPALRHQHLLLGAELGRRAAEPHRLGRRYDEFRRLSGGRARADRDRPDRAAHRLLRHRPRGRRRDRAGLGGLLYVCRASRDLGRPS